MKKILCILLLLLCGIAVNAQTTSSNNTQISSFTVTAPKIVKFMGKTYHFSHWECMNKPYQNTFIFQVCSTKLALDVDPTLPGIKDYRNMPYIEAVYRPLQHAKDHTPVSELKLTDEYISFLTDGRKDPYADALATAKRNKQDLNKNPILTCNKKSTISFSVFRGKTPILTISQITPWGTMGVARMEMTQNLKTYIHMICQEQFPEWLKNIDTKQTNTKEQKTQVTTKPTPVQKTVIPQLKKV